MRKYRTLLLAAAATTVARRHWGHRRERVAGRPSGPPPAPNTSRSCRRRGHGPASAIARGVFTAAGQARVGDARGGTIAFGGGTIVLSHRPAKSSSHFYPAGCLSLISQSGSYQIVRGTGRYAGISGHGTYQLSLEIVAARVHGGCSSAKPPVAQQELLRLAGPVRM